VPQRAEKLMPAAALRDGDPGAEHAARVVPKGAKIVPLGRDGRTGAIAGYLAKPARIARRAGLAQVRVAEIERLIFARVGGPLGGDAAPLVLAIAAAHLDHPAALAWSRRWCPDISPDDAIRIVADGAGRRWRAAALGEALGLRADERGALRIKTIRPAGLSGQAFGRWARTRKRESDRARSEEKRRAAGVLMRRKGDAAAAEAAEAGVSRRTILRRKRALALENREYYTTSIGDVQVTPGARKRFRASHGWSPAATWARVAQILAAPLRFGGHADA
jgi:hypothetical protein